MSSQIFQQEDILMFQLEETWSLRQETDSHHKNGTSINQAEPSETRKTTGLGTSKMLADQLTCKPTTPTQDGSNFSSGMVRTTSTMFRTRRFSMLLEAKIKKPPTFKSGRRMAQRPNHGISPMLRMLKRSKLRE
jgi:hypothetical protein